MKLRNLLFGTMIACAFVGCSNDDDPIPTPNPEPTLGGTASLVVSVKNSNLKTKAEGDDAKISSLKVVLYYSNDASNPEGNRGKFFAESETIVNVDGGVNDSNNEVKFTDLQLDGGASFQLLAVANVTGSFSGTSINSSTGVATPVVTGVPFTEANLPMSSGLTPAFTMTAGDNYFGYNEVTSITTGKISIGGTPTTPLVLVRNVARAQLSGLKLNVTQSTTKKYVSGTVKMSPTNVFILHARTESYIADGSANSTWWNRTSADAPWGSIATTYTTIESASAAKLVSGYNGFTNLAGSTTVENSYVKAINGITLTQDIAADLKKSEEARGVTATIPTDLYFYIFENNATNGSREDDGEIKSYNYATELVIKGEYQLVNVKDENGAIFNNPTPIVRYWPIKVGIDGIAQGSPFGGRVFRNVIYKITATVAGDGYKDPTVPTDGGESANLFVNTVVADWANATQDHPIE